MGRILRAALAALLVTTWVAALGTAPASAHSSGHGWRHASGPESFRGFLLVTGVSGERVVLASAIRAHGVFDGVGRIVELPSQPGDPDNLDRDDLVFRAGTLHLLSTAQSFDVNLDPRSCKAIVTVEQTSEFAGGTGIFRNASGTGTGSVHATAVAQRNPDGSCALDQPPKFELDKVSGSGTLTY